MNIEEYISSGILEAYALGDLSVEQRTEVEKNLVRHPQLKIELQRIEEAQEHLLMQAAIQPRATVKENLFKKLNTAAPEGKEVVIPSNIRFWQYSAAASIVFALTASYLAFTYYHKWQHTELSLTNLITQNEQIANNYNTVSNRLDEIEADLRITNNPAFNRVVLNGSANAPDAIASVYWNSGTQEVYLSIQNLKALTAENQFQLWALIDGQPVDMGVFDVTNGLIKMKTTARADAFAVTIEARGGSPVPSLQTLQVMGSTKG